MKRKKATRKIRNPFGLPAGYAVPSSSIQELQEINTQIRLESFLTYKTGAATSNHMLKLSGLLDASILPLLARRRFQTETGAEALNLLDSAQHTVLNVIERARGEGKYVFKETELETVLDALDVCGEVFQLTLGNFELSEWYAEMGAISAGAKKHKLAPYFITATEHTGAGQIKRFYQAGARQIPYYIGGIKFPEVDSDKA
jgi:hypothetical protein